MKKLSLPMLLAVVAIGAVLATVLPGPADAQTISTARRLHEILVDVGVLDSTGVASGACLKSGGTECLITSTVIFEGSTADDFETTVAVTDPTADRTITLPNVSGTVVTTGDSGTVTATMAADTVRTIPLQLAAFVPCDTGIWTAAGADALPDFAVVNGAIVIEYDDAAAPDTTAICTTIRVPADYVSGGSVNARVTADGATGAQTETWSCQFGVNGAALGAANAANLVSQAPIQTATSTPATAIVAGDSLVLACKQGNATPDDTINVLAIEFSYTANR